MKKDALDFLRANFGLNDNDKNELSSSEVDARRLAFGGWAAEDGDEDENAIYVDADDNDIDSWRFFDAEDDDEEDDEFEESEDQDGEIISERIVRKKVIRKGKRLIKFVTDRKGYRIQMVGPNRAKEVRMDAKEKRTRKKSQRIGARKRKRTSKMAQRKRSRSMKRRTF